MGKHGASRNAMVCHPKATKPTRKHKKPKGTKARKPDQKRADKAAQKDVSMDGTDDKPSKPIATPGQKIAALKVEMTGKNSKKGGRRKKGTLRSFGRR
eukprot:GEMP01068585.1.p2 GENE.GEMP01068585.1~~GEMP01068585.1.p2  ORF type:complete len:108 (+),score=24.16 GEMP01068585.1:33-326(+)